MIFVEFRGIEEGMPAVLGSIGWDGQQYISTLPDTEFQNVLYGHHVVFNPQTQQIVAPNDPQQWLSCLEFHFRSPYFRASPAMEGLRITPPSSHTGVGQGPPSSSMQASPQSPDNVRM